MSAPNQTDIEIETLVGSYKNLQDAREKFKDSLDAIQVQRELPDGKDIMVPLTGSMYVAGHLKDPQDFFIDIGTHYLLERDADGAADYFERKLKFIDLQLAKFSKLLNVRPDMSKADRDGWKPVVDLARGVSRTIEYFKQEVKAE